MKSESYTKRVGLLFGSFNPVHKGHVILAESALLSGAVDEVWCIVSPHNPDKDPNSLAPFEHRLHMVRLAIGEREGIVVSDAERDLPSPSYTYVTLRLLREQFPDTKFYLIGGADILETFHLWEEYEEMKTHHGLLIKLRSGQKATLPEELDITILPGVFELSATQIRSVIHDADHVKDLLEEKVFSYIQENNLYKR